MDINTGENQFTRKRSVPNLNPRRAGQRPQLEVGPVKAGLKVLLTAFFGQNSTDDFGGQPEVSTCGAWLFPTIGWSKGGLPVGRRSAFIQWSVVLTACLFSVSLCAQDWRPVPGKIMTRWADKVDPNAPLPEYPRPQMVRLDWVNLNGLWDYSIQPLDGITPDKWDGKILVPYPVESALSGVRKPLTKMQKLWYRRTFKAPNLAGGKRLLLHFGAVNWEAKVSVNGKPAGDHRGGYDPFTFDITDEVKSASDNEIIISVSYPTNSYQPKGKQNFNKFAKPGGIAYTACSGIWQTVWIEPVEAVYIKSVKFTPDVKAGLLRLRVSATDGGEAGKVEAVGLDDTVKFGSANGKLEEDFVLPVPNAKLWSPENPHLYTLKLSLGRDTVTCYFAMRDISIGRDEKGFARTMLNGKFVFQSGPLDQGYWPDGLYTAPTDEALRFDIEEMKKLGFNMVRKHLKVEPDRWYYWCDKLGLMVWQDMPNGNGGKAASKEQDGVVNSPIGALQFESELKCMIDTHYNHPCIILWTIFNEGWGQYEVPRLTKWVKAMDPSRLVNSTSGWYDQHVGDLVDAHRYPGPACPPAESGRAAVLGEYGGLGLGVLGHAWVDSATWGYRSTSGPRQLTRKYLDLWRKVWQLKEKAGLCATVYTQLTDVETECNGLLTYDRAVEKVDVQQVSEAQHGRIPPPPTFKMVAATGQEHAVNWRYSFDTSDAKWTETGFDDSHWNRGPAGFGDQTASGTETRTSWGTDDIWLRREVVLKENELRKLAFKVRNDQQTEVYVNGVLAVNVAGRNSEYEEFEIKPSVEKVLHPGANLIAVHCHQSKLGRFIDVGLVQEND